MLTMCDCRMYRAGHLELYHCLKLNDNFTIVSCKCSVIFKKVNLCATVVFYFCVTVDAVKRLSHVDSCQLL